MRRFLVTVPPAAALAGACGLVVLLLAQPRWLARGLAGRTGSVVFAGRSRSRVALTFDDGPDPDGTAALLEVLDRRGASATFFLIGSRVAAHPSLARQVVEHGHEVGNHLWVDRPSIRSSPASFECDLVRTHEALLGLGVRATWLRPASGWFRPAFVAVAARHGYRVALGTVAPRDLRLSDPGEVRRFVRRRVRGGSVLVLHESHAPAPALARLVEVVLDDLADRGLAAVTLTQLLEPAGG